MFHYARLTKDFEHSDVEGPEVFHFVALEGTDDWVEVQPGVPLAPEHEEAIREAVEDYLDETWSCDTCGATAGLSEDVTHDPDCEGGTVSGTVPMRITRRYLRLQGADFTTIGDDS